MICPPCATAADRRAPRGQHCDDPDCTCGHRAADEDPGDEPFDLGPVLAVYKRLEAEADAHAAAVEAAIARLEAEPGDRTITFPRITTED
jgi:hypothetical protein